jgi:quinoprotein glucose dehydrogenase
VVLRNVVQPRNDVQCTPPPFGALVAVNLRTGALAWTVPLGDPASLKPELARLTPVPTGTPNLGGPITTAGGLVFIGATMDHALRAFDVETGRELWRGPLPGGARATPMTYAVGGRQFVVVSVGGSEDWGRGDYVVAFALPR